MGERPKQSTHREPASGRDVPEGLARALEWLNGRLEEPVPLETLAAVAGMRPRTLEAQFRRHLGTTPLGWMRRLRLARARQQLLSAARDANVTDVAMASGFTQLGRFAAYYRQQFGELPSQTLKAARSGRSARGQDDIDDEALRLSWRAMASAFNVGPAACSAAIADVERAQELAPQLALPKAIAAWCWSQRAAHNFDRTPELDRERSLRLAAEARRLAPHDGLALSLCAGAMTLTRRLADADRLIERSLAIEPWSPWGWVRRGWLSAYAGDDDGALRELRMTLRLMPFEPVRHLIFIGIGCVHFNAGRYERAVRWIEDGTAAVPQSYWADRVAVAGAALMGAGAEARRAAVALLRKDKDLTVEMARRAWPFPPSFMNRLGDGLLRAGVPKR
ncbi:helix-turn-helix domain-containing protein [Enhydrobacter sp.]|jgi:AraC-like DNA-binding protein|uniref:helix-turn-helix domain-containing protein n=1 Tax=Enhydrobacter sp. TaxID=1894999 RepID=UPI002633B3C2|nr:helix-turn-helix domain-containing protein [Enhydrobacter sp.]WIM13492.1 MAG: benABC operon transcriptional activator BenR [Enhydrobacter sp.]